MTRLKTFERNTKLRQLRRGQGSPGLSLSTSPQRQWCSALNLTGYICLFLNVVVWSTTLIANVRDIKEGEIPKEPLSEPSGKVKEVIGSATVAAVKANFQVDKLSVVPPANPKEQPTPLHFVFQTDCRDPAQNWQAYVLFHRMYKMNQPGEVTRVVTGCPKGRHASMEEDHKIQIEPMGRADPASPSRFHLHFAPAHPKQDTVGTLRADMKYFNRPFGVDHWMQHVLGYSENYPSNFHDGTVIIMLDTDMFVMRPFATEFDSTAEIWKELLDPQQPPQHVLPRQPLAQHTEMPSLWWSDLDAKSVSPDIRPALVSLQQLPQAKIQSFYEAGPPFMARAVDFYPLVQKWTEFTYPLYEAIKDRAKREPTAPYALAIAHLNMPHQLAESFAVSNYKQEAFGLFAASIADQDISTVMAKPEAQCRNVPTAVKPHVLQYDKRYALGDFIIGKHYVPRAFLGTADACTQALFAEPADNIAEHQRSYLDPERKGRFDIEQPIHALQMSILVCETIQALNEAGAYFRSMHCPNMPTTNYAKTLTFPGGHSNRNGVR
jgi:peptidyl serine alpha-galactosyltransferase